RLVHFLTRLFVKQGHEVASCTDGISGLDRVKSETFDLILLDYKMPGLNGLETLLEIKHAQIKTPVIVMTAYGTTETAIEAMKLGAYDYLLKPFDTEGLKRLAADALEVNRLMKEIVSLPSSVTKILPAASGLVRIVGTSRQMQEVFKLIGQVAAKDVSVLITGESGTGKELVARAVYHHSHRNDKPFMAVNCASIPDTLFESELFGYERGAFTGAYRSYVGKFERCHAGTLFFDEIGDMSLSTQAKVLRVLQEGEFERLGSTEIIKVDVRVFAATNKNLEREIEEGRFREDLYYRLKVICIELPPLRERLDDVPALVKYFAGRFSEEYGKSVHYVADQTIHKLQACAWPGNVRELENHLRRAVLMCKGDVLLAEHVQFEAEQENAPQADTQEELIRSLKQRLADLVPEILRLADQRAHANVIDLVEEALITRALQESEYNQVRTARMLGISRNTLRHRIKKYSLGPPRE
ncbi:MAG: sigma-54-dependent transcriptional regulator, partial [Planctomycetota bacterium]